MIRIGFMLLFIASVLAACSDQSPTSGDGATGPIWFADEAADRGVDFTYVSGADPDEYLMAEIMGGGAALFDMDDDGDLDAYLVQGGDLHAPGAATNRLFANDGAGSFADVSVGSGADVGGYGMGVAAGDVDGDGRPDLYVTNWGANALLVNRSEGAVARFEELGTAAGVSHEGWATSAVFFDRDLDGDLDLYVCNYVNWQPSQEMQCDNRLGELDYCGPSTYEAPAFDVLYDNLGDGRFSDVSKDAGVEAAIGPGLGVAAGDFDEDGDFDVFVANDDMQNLLWQNAGDGSFTEEALMLGCAVDGTGVTKAGMGVAVGDIDDDGDLDVMVCNLTRESDSLYVNERGLFSDRTARAGLATGSRPYTRFGIGWGDFDQDGTLDLFQANGRVMRALPAHADDPYAEPNLVFRGRAGQPFEELGRRGGMASPVVATSRAAAFGDVDGDGGVDILVVNRDAPVTLMMNRHPARGHWITFRVADGAWGAAGLHARFSLTRDGRTLRRDARSGYSYLAASDVAVHFGLGTSGAPVDALTVTWPDGTVERFGPFDVDRVVEVARGAGSK